MTPGERQYDIKLVKSARDAAKLIARRSSKFALIMNQCADRLDALSSSAPLDAMPQVDEHGELKQPASTPE